jgi:hypothetical protein
MKKVKLFEQFINEAKPKNAPDWHDSDAPDAEGRFKDLSIEDLAAWLIKTRNGDVKKISGSLTQQVVFNRNDDPEYADKMEKTRKEVYKQLGREDLLEYLFFYNVDESVGTGGIEYEGKIHDALVAANIDGLDAGDKPGAGFSNQGAGDLELKLNGKDFNVEVKMDAGAQMGGTSFKFDLKNGKIIPNADLPSQIIDPMMAAMKSKAGDIEKYIDAVNQLHAQMGIDYKATGIPIKVAVPVRDKLKSAGLLKGINTKISIPSDFLIKHYNKKGVNYINIGKGAGLFYIGKNPLGLPIPEFKPDIQVEIRLAYAGGKVSFDANGKEIPARNGSIRAQSRLVKFKDKSPYNLDDPKSIQAMFAKMKK